MTHTDEIRGHTTCAFDVYPDVVDAGAEITLRGRVSCSPGCNLQGHTLIVKDQAGADVGSVELTTFTGGTSETSEFVVKAPVESGAYTWVGVCPTVVKEGVSYAEASAPISFTVTRHSTSVAAWDVPSAIVVGERFRLKVGISCSSACPLTNRAFEIYDHTGAQVATGALPDDRWPDTAGLYVAEIELEAPVEEGLFTWSVKSPQSDLGIPHAEGAISLGIRVVTHPECLVTVEAVDQDSLTPLSGARVVMHPYRAVTDERGIAEMRVPKGPYTLFVSQTSYLTFGLPVEVTADMTARAELCLEPVPERN